MDPASLVIAVQREFWPWIPIAGLQSAHHAAVVAETIDAEFQYAVVDYPGGIALLLAASGFTG